jgi:hypothetical protein
LTPRRTTPIIPARRTILKARIDSESRRRSLLRAIEKALLEAIAESSAVHRTLWQLQRAGYQLRLSVDCRETSPALPSSMPASPAEKTPGTADERRAETSFRIDGEDLRFLRSLGIDPTRVRRPRRRS